MRIEARLVAHDGDAVFGISSRQVGGHVEVDELVGKRAAVGGLVARTNSQDFERAPPVEGEVDLENVGVGICGGGGARLGSLADCGCGVVNPDPVIDGIFRGLAESGGEGRVAPVDA